MKKYILLILNIILLYGVNRGFSAQGFHRYAFIVGANNGGAGRVMLRYAVADAQSMYKVLQEMGGLASEDTVFLSDPDASAFWQGLNTIKARLKNANTQDQHIEIVVYYSGHASEKGLLLGGEVIPFKEFRDSVGALPADVRIAIVDACSSGQITRAKGGKMLPPFMLDSSTSMEGYAFLTSSSEDESSQESDSIGGSFFTHYLISGLRGGADRNQDGQVTLHETYQFAFDETLARTEQTMSGPQHPGYDIQMKGSGDVVLTDVRNTSAILLIDTDLWGRFFIRNSQGKLVAELNKAPGKATELGLAPGNYSITLDKQNQLYTADITLSHKKRSILFPWQMKKIQGELAVNRGEPLTRVITNQIVQTNTVTNTVDTDDSMISIKIPKNNIHITVPNQKDLKKNIKDKIDQKLKKKDVEYFSFNIASGKTKELSGVSFSLGYKGVSKKMSGVMFSMGANHVGDQSEGSMFSLGLNQVDGDMQGVQMTLGNNQVGNTMRGVQLSLGMNSTGKHMQGAQLSTGANLSTLNHQGVQMAVGYNYAGATMMGIQLSSGANVTKGNMIGLQLSSGVNISQSYANGLQLGTVNISRGTLQGGQLGLVNIGDKIQGVQIGLINIANDVSGLPLGLFNFIKNGNNRLHYWTDEMANQNVGFSMGSKYMYSIYNVSIPVTNTHISLGIGLGLHFPSSEHFYWEMEAIAEYIHPLDGSFQWWWEAGYKSSIMYRGRLALGWKIGKRFSVIGGISYNIYQPGTTDNPHITPLHGLEASWVNDNMRSWPGFFLGVNLYR